MSLTEFTEAHRVWLESLRPRFKPPRNAACEDLIVFRYLELDISPDINYLPASSEGSSDLPHLTAGESGREAIIELFFSRAKPNYTIR